MLGLWHLGTVTASCLAESGHDVTGLDVDSAVVAQLTAGTPPLFEPDLEALVKAGLAAGRLRFTTDAAAALDHADLVWVTYDTPVDEDDRADVDYVVERIARIFPHLPERVMLLVSSQLPVGTTRRLENRFAAAFPERRVSFAYSPENLRLGKAIAAFRSPDRIVAGVRAGADRDTLDRLFSAFNVPIEWMSVESAEMTKHALNAFLATSVTFINEIAAMCEQVGADAREVERGLKSELRIGPRAYLSPGPAFSGGTLARDIVFLSDLARAHDVPAPLVSSVKVSNDQHRHWAQRRLAQLLPDSRGCTVAVWGLTYKPGTDTLRRSASLELCEWLDARGTKVQAHDPVVSALPKGIADRIMLAATPLDAALGASALVIATPWPEYRQVAASALKERMARALVLDAACFLGQTLGRDASIQYLGVGMASA